MADTKATQEPSYEQIVEGSGKEIGENWLQNAVKTAENNEQLENHINCLKYAGMHIITSYAFNVEKQEGKDGDTYIDELAKKMKADLEAMRVADEAGHIEFMETPKGKTADADKPN